MEELISKKYQMELTQKVEEVLWDKYGSYRDVRNYISKWHKEEEFWENFMLYEKKEGVIDLNKTLHNMDGELILKIAIDLGIDTPDFIPSIPTFKNELKTNYTAAHSIFERAIREVENDPSLAIGLANSALESIIKEILKDERIECKVPRNKTLYQLSSAIVKEFNLIDAEHPVEIKTIGSSLLAINQAIETIRSTKTNFHGKVAEDLIINDSLYAYFVINAVTTVGMFLISFYKTKFPSTIEDVEIDDLPF